MSSEKSYFASIPLDLLENILENLDLEDIRNARLTCKSLGTIGPRFKSFFTKQSTDLSSESLRQQMALASHPQLRSAVSTLVVMAVAIDTSVLDQILKTRKHRIVQVQGVFTSMTQRNCTKKEVSQATEDLKWMHSQQSDQHSQTLDESAESLAAILGLYGRLDTIDVDACVMTSPNKRVSTNKAGEWHPVFTRASEVYQITTSAIVKSQVSVKTLLFYRTTPRCSVPSFDVTTHVADLGAIPGFESTLSEIENFALSFSTRVPTDFSHVEAGRARLDGAAAAFHNAMGSNAGRYSSEDEQAIAEENFPGIARMLKPMTKLDAFDLHMINALRGQSTNYQKIFAAIANEVKLPVLTQVFIRGLPSSEESLLKFIENHPTINDLTLREVDLRSGSWNHVIQRILRLPALSRLSLSNLISEGRVFNLRPRNSSKDQTLEYESLNWSFPCARAALAHTREFNREEIQTAQRNIDFDDLDTVYPLGSIQHHKWLENRRAEFSL